MPQLLVTVNDQAMLPRIKAVANIKGGLEELKLYRKGELQFQPAEALLEEL